MWITGDCTQRHHDRQQPRADHHRHSRLGHRAVGRSRWHHELQNRARRKAFLRARIYSDRASLASLIHQRLFGKRQTDPWKYSGPSHRIRSNELSATIAQTNTGRLQGSSVATKQYFGEGKQRWIELLIPGAETKIALFIPEGHENRIGGFQPVTFRCDDVFPTAEAPCGRKGLCSPQSRKRRCGEGEQFSAIRTEMSLSFPVNKDRSPGPPVTRDGAGGGSERCDRPRPTDGWSRLPNHQPESRCQSRRFSSPGRVFVGAEQCRYLGVGVLFCPPTLALLCILSR